MTKPDEPKPHPNYELTSIETGGEVIVTTVMRGIFGFIFLKAMQFLATEPSHVMEALPSIVLFWSIIPILDLIYYRLRRQVLIFMKVDPRTYAQKRYCLEMTRAATLERGRLCRMLIKEFGPSAVHVVRFLAPNEYQKAVDQWNKERAGAGDADRAP